MYGQRAALFLATFALLVASGCAFNPNLGDGQVRCGSERRCPPGQQCEDDGLCYAPATAAGNSCIPTHCFVGWCGAVPDGCGHMLDCGPCNPPPPDLGTPDLAGCTPSIKCIAGESCGNIDDGCGRQLHCGDCATPGTCSADKPNRCGCVPKTCKDVGATCGAYPDGCGGVNNCSSDGQARCAPGSGFCSGGGPYTCGKTKGCKPLEACPTGACGLIPDGCRRYLDCACPAGQVCGGGGKANVCG
jgi:hypothetical protein